MKKVLQPQALDKLLRRSVLQSDIAYILIMKMSPLSQRHPDVINKTLLKKKFKPI